MKAMIKYNTIFRNEEGIVKGILKKGDVIDVHFNDVIKAYHNDKYGYFMDVELEVLP